MSTIDEFSELESYLRRVPSIGDPATNPTIGKGRFPDGNWWVKFGIDIDYPLAWNVVQEFGNVLNYLSITDRLPTVFKPVSPPSYLNGGPKQFLSWVIESENKDLSPSTCAQWLEGRLPRPVENIEAWKCDD
jgi:hypothetical protein